VFDSEEQKGKGLNAKHVAGRRNLVADAVLGRYDKIMNGDPLVFNMRKLARDWNEEEFSRVMLESQGIALGHIPTIAYLSSCPKWARDCWRAGVNLYQEEMHAAIANSASFTMFSCWSKVAEDKLLIATSGQCQQSLLQMLGIRSYLTPKRVIGGSILMGFVALAFVFAAAFGAIRLFCLGATYFIASVAILFVNKYVMNAGRFPHPVSLVMLHMVTCTTFSSLMKHFIAPSWFPTHKQLEGEKGYAVRISILGIAACFALSLCLENAALMYSTVAFLQMVKEPNLILLAVMSWAAGQDALSKPRVFLLVVVVVGALLIINGEVHLSVTGLALQFTSSMFNCVRLVLQAKLLVKDAGIRLDPISYLSLVAPACLVSLVPAAGMEWFFTESSIFSAFKIWWPPILLSCFLACGLNLVIAGVIREVSSLGFSLMGSFKSALVIVTFFVAVDAPTTLRQISGTVIVFVSIASYSTLKARESMQA